MLTYKVIFLVYFEMENLKFFLRNYFRSQLFNEDVIVDVDISEINFSLETIDEFMSIIFAKFITTEGETTINGIISKYNVIMQRVNPLYVKFTFKLVHNKSFIRADVKKQMNDWIFENKKSDLTKRIHRKLTGRTYERPLSLGEDEYFKREDIADILASID